MRRLSVDKNGTTIVLTKSVLQDLDKYQPGKYTVAYMITTGTLETFLNAVIKTGHTCKFHEKKLDHH